MGHPAVFCRFSGCNLWSGRENSRSSSLCRFCDTDFVGTNGPNGGHYLSGDDVAQACTRILEHHIQDNQSPSSENRPLVVLTGGEPMLQVDPHMIDALHRNGFTVAVETNGTIPVPPNIDWICVSPKARTSILQTSGDELKLVYPQPGLLPDFLYNAHFKHFFLQPMDGPHRLKNTAAAIAYCKSHPRWRLSLQTHKFTGIA